MNPPAPVMSARVLGITRLSELDEAEQVGGGEDNEQRVVRQVSPPETGRLLAEAVGPLQPGPLHCHRRSAKAARVIVERRPNGHKHLGVESTSHGRGKALLFGRSETDPNDVGARPVDRVRNRLELVRRKIPKWWGGAARHLEAWKPRRKSACQLLGDAGR